MIYHICVLITLLIAASTRILAIPGTVAPMSTSAPLLIDLSGVARLADVQRPVASMWRSRFASEPDAFPRPVSEKDGRAQFDAHAVAQWLARTGHGNNADAVADAAAAASPAGFDIANPAHVAAVDALLALRAYSADEVGALSPADLHFLAREADPEDAILAREAVQANPEWARWADELADAAYSPLAASQLLERRHAATRSSAGSAGTLETTADELLKALAAALIDPATARLALGTGITPSLATDIYAPVSDELSLTLSSHDDRVIRRRLMCASLPVLSTHTDQPSLHVMRLPADGTTSDVGMLDAISDVVLDMRPDDRAIVLAPAAILTDPPAPGDSRARSDLLRSGRVRAIVKLPVGLISSAPREALALWVLGPETPGVRIDDRVTTVADLTDVALTRAARADLTSDVLAGMGSRFDIQAHAFRFGRPVRTAALLATPGSLVAAARKHGHAPAVRDLPALIDQARTRMGSDAPADTPVPASGTTPGSLSVEELRRNRHLRVLPGTRITAHELSETGLVVVQADDLDSPTGIGTRRIDPLAFAPQHPSAKLTMPGDIVFRTSPTAAAWVDPDGSKVVAHPARILRVNGADSGGLVPDLVAADINRASGGPGSWRRWTLRRVAPNATGALRRALRELATTRETLNRRIEALDAYADLLADGIASGAVALSADPQDDLSTETP